MFIHEYVVGLLENQLYFILNINAQEQINYP